MTEHVRQHRLFLHDRIPHAWSVRFDQNSVSPQGERCDLAECMVANVAVGDAVVRNDFDKVSIFQRPIFNATWDKEKRRWCDFVARGEAGFTLTPTEEGREVLYRCKPFWYRLDMEGAQGPSFVSVTDRPLKGYTLAPMFQNGSDFVYRPCFELALGEDGKPHSRAGLVPYENSAAGVMAAARLFDSAAHTERMADWFSDYLLLLVEFATRSLQSVMRGVVSRPLTVTWQKTAGDGVEAGFYVEDPATVEIGARVLVNYTSPTANDGKAYHKIVGLGEATAIGYPVYTTIADMAAFLADKTTCKLSYVTCLTGEALSHVTNASSGTWGSLPSSPFVWRGKENAWGNLSSLICDMMFDNDREGGMGVCHLEDMSKYTGELNEHYMVYDYGKPYMTTRDTYSYIVRFEAFGKPHLLVPSVLQKEYPEYYWATYTRHAPRSHKGLANLSVGGDYGLENGINHGTYEIAVSTTANGYGGRLIVEEGIV